MPDIKMPDGAIVRFPDSMPKEQIKSLIASKFPDIAKAQAEAETAKNEPFNYSLLPIHVDERGRLSPGIPAAVTGVIDSAKSAVTAPYRALTGELKLTNEDGSTSDEAIAEAFNMAGWATPTSVAAGTGKQIARNAAAARVPSEGAQVAQAANDIGVTLPRAVTSDSPTVQNVGKRLSQVPIVGNPLRNASRNSVQQLDDAAKGVQDKLGAGSKEFAGERVRDDIAAYAKIKEPASVTALYNKVDEVVDLGVRVPLSDTARVAAEIIATRKYQGPSKAVEAVKLALDDPSGLNYKEIKELRTSIGELTKRKGALDNQNISQDEIDAIYSGLSADLKAAAKTAGGPEGLARFERANEGARIFARDKEALKKILGEGSDEKTVSNLVAMASDNSRANIKGLLLAKSKVSKETWDELASAALDDMGRDTTGAFTPDRFVTAWGKMSDNGKKLIFGGNPEHIKALDDIAKVSTRFKKLNEFANPSGTGGQNTLLAAGASLGAGYFEPTILAGSAISAMTGYGLSSFLARPASAKALAEYSKAYEVAVKMPSPKTQNALATKAKALALIAANGNREGASNLAANLATIKQTAAEPEGHEQIGRPVGNPEPAKASQQLNDAYLQGRAL